MRKTQIAKSDKLVYLYDLDVIISVGYRVKSIKGVIFRKVCLALTEKYELSKEEGLAKLIKCWSLVHGITALIISPNVELKGDWADHLKTLFNE